MRETWLGNPKVQISRIEQAAKFQEPSLQVYLQGGESW
jgi:hypothetical protein